jgi:molybdenum cofactor cytidylyltransferase
VQTHPEKKVAILLLAAGPSKRLGTPKQLLPYRNRSLLRYITEISVASKACRTCIVLGAETSRLEKEIADLPVESVHNPEWKEGIGSSIRSGIATMSGVVDAILIMLCDQPLVSVELLDEIIGAYRSSGKAIVACEYEGHLGVPALFDRSLFPELAGLGGDKGAKQIIAAHSAEAYRIAFPEGAVDIDTIKDYQSLVL